MSLSGFSQQDDIATDGIPARQVAYAVLNDIFFQRKSMDEAFARSEGFESLSGRDRGFVRLLVSVVLKRFHEIDKTLQALFHEPAAQLKPPQLINIFRLGVAQFVFLETKAHAAVNTSVMLAEAEGIHHQKSFVNAVMRRLTREGVEKLELRDAGRLNTPNWLWQEWMRDYGVETALDIAAAHLTEAPVDITVKSDPESWAKKLAAELLPTGSLRKTSTGFIPDLPGFEDGAWWIQGAAAALPARLMGDVRGKKVVDLCAAPGGKTAQLASMGAKVIAVDRSAERMKRLDENMKRLHLSVESVVADGAVWQPRELVDAVLLDAPCTATGTIRHQPDVLLLKEPKDQEKLSALQRRLMLNALKMLKPGGMLVYCTCSLQKAEGEYQTSWLLEQGTPVRLDPITSDESCLPPEMITGHGEIRCLPSHWKDTGGMDGFYIARFIKQ